MRQTINRRPNVRDFSYVNPAELCPCYSCSQFGPKVPLIRPNFKTWQIHSTGAEFLISMFELDLLINHFYTSRCKVHQSFASHGFQAKPVILWLFSAHSTLSRKIRGIRGASSKTSDDAMLKVLWVSASFVYLKKPRLSWLPKLATKATSETRSLRQQQQTIQFNGSPFYKLGL